PIWGIYPISFRYVHSLLMFLPSKRIFPELGTTIPKIDFINVVFPLPLGPISEIHCPDDKERLISLSTWSLPNFLESCSISIIFLSLYFFYILRYCRLLIISPF